MQQYFDVALMERRRDAKVPRAAWEEFLRSSFAANKPYDQLVREILSADGADPKRRAAAKFFLDRDLEPNVVTRDIGRLFLGRNLQCAQCHDHPLVDDYKQDHYYGIQAFLNRTFLFPNAAGADRGHRREGRGRGDVHERLRQGQDAEDDRPARCPGGKPIAEPKLEKGKEYKVAPAKDVRPVPTYSRRARWRRRSPSRDNPAFRRTAANRLWAMMIGRGLVHPLDLDHPGNPPSHPELLDLLADEFAAHKFDVKWLLREIALSKTYQRSSEVPAGAKDLAPDRFAVAPLKPLSPEQLAYARRCRRPASPDAERLASGPG